MAAYSTTYCEAIFVDGDLLDKVTTTDAHLFFRQQVVDYNVCQVLPFLQNKKRRYKKPFWHIFLFVNKYLNA